jgi:cysteine desulfuration protein SufE
MADLSALNRDTGVKVEPQPSAVEVARRIAIVFAAAESRARRWDLISRLTTRISALPDIDEITENFALLDDWDDRYRYVIELGRALPPLPDAARTDANKVQGCASQVWLQTTVRPDGDGGPVLNFLGDSDAHIVKGLIAILFALYSGKPAKEILALDALGLFDQLALREHLTPQRSNGFRSMVERIRAEARGAMAA